MADGLVLRTAAASELADRIVFEHGEGALDFALCVVRSVASAGRLAVVRKCVSPQQALADSIVAAVCGHFSITNSDLFSLDRSALYTKPRRVAWALVSWRLRWSTTRVGAMFNRDHTTILYGLRKLRVDDADVVAVEAMLDAIHEAAE